MRLPRLPRRALRFAFQPRAAAGALRGADLVEVLYFVRDFLAAADLPFQFALSSAARSHFHGERVAGIHPQQFLARFLTGGLALKFDNGVADLQARMLGVAAGGDGCDRHGAVEVAGGDETRIRHGVRNSDYTQSDRAEEIIPRNLVGPGYILREERRKVGVADGFGGLANAVGIVEEAALLRVVRVHPLQDFAQRRLSVAGVAHREIEHHAQQFAFVVVGDAALGTAVVAVALEPGIEARFLGRLREVRGTTLEFGDFLAEPGEILLLIEQAGAQLNGAFGGAGHAFAEPQRARVIFFGVVHGLERLRADALDVPQMEEFVRGDAGERVQRLLHHVGIEFDGGGVGVLHAAARGAVGKVIEERVGVEGTIVHPTGGRGDNLVERGNDLGHVVVGGIGVDDHAEVAAGFVEVGFLKVPDLDGRVDQAVVIRGAVLVARG